MGQLVKAAAISYFLEVEGAGPISLRQLDEAGSAAMVAARMTTREVLLAFTQVCMKG